MTSQDQDDGRLLSPSAYQKLLTQIRRLAESADETSNVARISSTWNIGARISAARLSQRVGYHNSVLRELAQDSGISVRVLQESVAFREAYEEPPQESVLTWSHYRKLITLPVAERTRLQAAAVKNAWSARDLAAAIADFVKNEGTEAKSLRRPEDPTYLFAARITDVIDGDTVHADIDLGFAVTRHEKLRLSQVDAPDLKTQKGRAAQQYLSRQLSSARALVITTERVDLHGRYVAHLFTSPVPVSILTCFQTGKHLNAALIDAGHGVYRAK